MNYLAAFLGSLLFIAIRLKIEKQKSDDNPRYHIRWKKYIIKELDDWAFSLVTGAALVFFMHDMFFGYAAWKEYDINRATEFYESAELALAGACGLFGSLVIMVIFKYVIRKLAKYTNGK